MLLLALALLAPPPDGLPLRELPAPGNTLAVFMSGDGGWASIDKDISRALADSGIATVGLDALKYLGTRRTPDEVAADVAAILRTYLDRWHKERILLIGYSRGADIMPFAAARLPADLLARIDLVALLGLGHRTGFHVTILSMLHQGPDPSDRDVAPEIARLVELKVPLACVYGLEEKDSLCRDWTGGGMTRIARPGAHHFDSDRAGIAALLLQARRREG